MSGTNFIPSDDNELHTWLDNFRVKLLEILEAFGLIQRLGGAINGGGTTINLAQGPFSGDIQLKAKNDSVNMVGISIGLAATPTTFIEPAITGGKVVGFGEEKTFLLSELGTGNFLNMTNPYTDAGSLQVSIASPQVLGINGSIIELQQEINEVNEKRNDWKQAAEKKNNNKHTTLHLLRDFIQKKIKANDTYTTDIGKDLDIIAESQIIDPINHTVDATVKAAAGRVRIDFVKHGVDGIDIEKRKQNETVFRFIAHDTISPYIDTETLLNPAIPEKWTYRIWPVAGSVRIGQPTIITIDFGG